MKKLYVVAILAVAVASMTACHDKKHDFKYGSDDASVIAAKIANAPADSVEEYVSAANFYAEYLVAENKNEEAKAYLDVVIPAIKAKDPSLVADMATAVDVDNHDLSEGTTTHDTRAVAAEDTASAHAGDEHK